MALKRGRQLGVAQVTMQRRAAGREPGGGRMPDWEDVWTRPGRVVPGTAADAQRMMQRDETVSHRLLFAQDPQATAANRFVVGGRVMMFRGVMNPHEAGRFWVVYAEESGFLSRNP